MRHLGLIAAGLVALALPIGSSRWLTAARAATPDQSARPQDAHTSKRLADLRAEADQLLAQERTLLAELRRFEVERQIQTERLREIDGQRAALESELADTKGLIDSLERQRAAQLPALRARLIELYKLGRGGYVRLLFDVEDARDLGRAMRTVSALAAMDRERVRAHESTLASLRRARAALEQRGRELAALRQQAAAARGAIDRTVADRRALVHSIDARRDLNAQLTSELAAAQQRLQHTVTGLESGTAAAQPIAPLRGALDWPLAGSVTARFGSRRLNGTGPGAVRNGIEIAAAAGSPVTAVQEGRVAYAAPFTGFGTLVIVDHGRKSYSLYGYLDEAIVQKGARVTRDQRLGTVGLSPAGEPLLYFELRVDGRPVDPLQWLKPGSP